MATAKIVRRRIAGAPPPAEPPRPKTPPAARRPVPPPRVQQLNAEQTTVKVVRGFWDVLTAPEGQSPLDTFFPAEPKPEGEPEER